VLQPRFICQAIDNVRVKLLRRVAEFMARDNTQNAVTLVLLRILTQRSFSGTLGYDVV
jgi:hypothetical protein